MHVSALEATIIHPSWAGQIAALQWKKAPTKIWTDYSNYADVFSTNLAIELPENTGVNKHAIKLIEE